MRVELAARRENILGEGPLWDQARGRLYWVDIRGKLIEWMEPDSGAAGTYRLPVRPSALALRAQGGLLVAADRVVGVLDLQNGAFEPRVGFDEDRPANRTNDGAVGADGRFWFGTMDDGGKSGRGRLYALSPDWRLSVMRENIGIPNGIVGLPDGTLYVADSFEQVIWSHAATGDTLSAPSMFFSAKGEKYTPDGAAPDEEGCLWSAQWDGACILRLAPDGTVALKIGLPVSRPTACAFGGPDLRTLFITSARDGLGPEQLAREPLAGSVFSVRLDTRGAGKEVFAG